MCLAGSIFTQKATALVNANANAIAEQQQALLVARREASLEAAWGAELLEEESSGEAEQRKNPVKRVVNLLNKMKAELEAEADKESEMYDKMVCWCESNEKEKTQAVAEADAKDDQLGSEIERRAARFGELATKIEATKKEVAANKDTLAKATAIREQEAAQFREENKDLLQAVANLRNAITVLSKHHGGEGSLIQLNGPVLAGMRVLLRDVALKYEEMMAGRAERRRFEPKRVSLMSLVTKAQGAGGATDPVSKVLLSALDVKDDSVAGMLPLKFAARVVARELEGDKDEKFLQVDGEQPLFKSYNARSGQIYGILGQMKDEFEAELKAAQDAENRAAESYKAMAAAKTAEIEAGEQTLDEMEVEHAQNQKALADAKEDLTLTREQRSKDVEFLRNLKLTCNDMDAQWEKRSQTRSAEVQAIAEALAVLSEDDSRETMAKAVAFLQVETDTAARRARAAATLRKAAQAPGFDTDDLLEAWHGRSVGPAAGPKAQLSTLAMAVQLDSFKKVKEMIDRMLAALQEQQQQEVDLKAHCTEELHTNEKATYDKGVLKKDLEATIDRLDQLVQQLEGEIAEAKKQIADTTVEIKHAGQRREVENGEFQKVVADQRATQVILAKALAKLQDFYEKKIGQVVLLQRAGQEPPVKFNAYKTHGGGNTVIALIEQIIGDSKRLEAEASTGEHDAQQAYEKFVMESNDMITGLQKAATSKAKAIASSKSDQAEASENLENTISELESLADYRADLGNQCNFLLHNFDVRQTARLQEMESIRSAKAILSGMK